MFVRTGVRVKKNSINHSKFHTMNSNNNSLYFTAKNGESKLPKFSVEVLEDNYDVTKDKDRFKLVHNFLHNPEAWSTTFQHFTNPKKLNRDGIKGMRVLIIRQTMQVFGQSESLSAPYCSNWKYLSSNNVFVEFNREQIISQVCKSMLYDNFVSTKKQIQNNEAILSVFGGDCVEAAITLKKLGYNPALLNMADAHSPGGGYMWGAGAQEENLHRRSNLHQHLGDPDNIYRSKRKWKYPIPDYGVIYSPNVVFFRSSEPTGYAFMDEPVALDVVSTAADRHPKLIKHKEDVGKEELRLHPQFEERFEKRITNLFEVVKEMGNDSLVLSALGCGAFKNPPKHVAEIFHRVITTRGYDKHFKVIQFAIINDHNSHQKHNVEGNFKPFLEVFGEAEIPALNANNNNNQ